MDALSIFAIVELETYRNSISVSALTVSHHEVS